MSATATQPVLAEELPPAPDTSHLITEDGAPVDNIFSEKNQRLLTEPIHGSAKQLFGGRPFVAAANVGIFYSVHQPAIVPDMFLSLDAETDADWWQPAGRSYLVWEAGKPPDVVVEIVSNTQGEELRNKMQLYARLRATYYVVFDPCLQIQDRPLRVFVLSPGGYVETEERYLAEVGLGLKLWDGVYEDRRATWLRWCDRDGNVLPTGQERADEEKVRAERELARAERLASQLRAAGIEPEA
ncbi:MAG: Uma2 family endonuclease [Acidobacteriota bacterium]